MHKLLEDDNIDVMDVNKILQFLERDVTLVHRNEDLKSVVDIVAVI